MEKHRFRVSENGMLRRIRNFQLLLRYKIKEDEMGGTCSTHGVMRILYKILV
jgi:hypothetical protein